MVAATGDWTNETPTVEYPAMQRIYRLFGAEDHVYSVQFQAPHNYNRNSREAVYAWMARWLQGAPADVKIEERPFTVERLWDLMVFLGRSLPDGALTPEQLTDQWITAARRQLQESDRKTQQSALPPRARARTPAASHRNTLEDDHQRERRSERGRHAHTRRLFGPARLRDSVRRAAAAKIDHFDTYNRTAASQRVADLVQALDESPGATLVADGDWSLPALLAAAVTPVSRVIVDVDRFDTGSDQAFVERLYMPGLRRAGDLQTAMAMTSASVIVHNAGDHFTLDKARVQRDKITLERLVELVR
jgi:hypothetical protein